MAVAERLESAATASVGPENLGRGSAQAKPAEDQPAELGRNSEHSEAREPPAALKEDLFEAAKGTPAGPGVSTAGDWGPSGLKWRWVWGFDELGASLAVRRPWSWQRNEMGLAF